MARRKLSLEDQLRGVEAAIRSPRTPRQLREGLRRRMEALEKALGKSSGETKKSRRRSFFDDFFRL